MQRPSNQLFDAYFTARTMRDVFSDQGRVQAMLDFEAALARAEASIGLIPTTAVAPIAAACQAGHYDFAALGEAIATAGNSAIPLVKALGKQIALQDPEAERYVHLGATSQDAMDSGLVLQLRDALELIEADLARLADALAQQAQRHIATPLAGRTWLQHATPVTLGMKIAGWLGALTRTRQRLQALKAQPMFDLLSVDCLDAGTLRHWQQQLGHLSGNSDFVDWQPAHYRPWQLTQRHCLNPGSIGAPIFQLRLSSSEDVDWRAGDIVEVGPRHAPQRVSACLQQLGLDPQQRFGHRPGW